MWSIPKNMIVTNSKTQKETKLKKIIKKCDKSEKLKLWQNYEIKTVTKL